MIRLTEPPRSRHRSVSSPFLRQVDTVDNFHGLERLIAIILGLDEVGSPTLKMRSRSRLYCGVTRAQIFMVVVNEFLHGGCLEFLGHLELKKDHVKVENEGVVPGAAARLMEKQKQEAEKIEEVRKGMQKPQEDARLAAEAVFGREAESGTLAHESASLVPPQPAPIDSNWVPMEDQGLQRTVAHIPVAEHQTPVMKREHFPLAAPSTPVNQPGCGAARGCWGGGAGRKPHPW